MVIVKPKGKPISDAPGAGPRLQLRHAFLAPEAQDIASISLENWDAFEATTGCSVHRSVLLSHVRAECGATDTGAFETSGTLPDGELLRLLLKNVSESAEVPLSRHEIEELRALRSSLDPPTWRRWLVYARGEKLRLAREQGGVSSLSVEDFPPSPSPEKLDDSRGSRNEGAWPSLRPALLAAEETASRASNALHVLRRDDPVDVKEQGGIVTAEVALGAFAQQARLTAAALDAAGASRRQIEDALAESLASVRKMRLSLHSLRGEAYRCFEDISKDLSLFVGAVSRLLVTTGNEGRGSHSRALPAASAPQLLPATVDSPVSIICRVPRARGASAVTVSSSRADGSTVVVDVGSDRLAFHFAHVLGDALWDGPVGMRVDASAAFRMLRHGSLQSWVSQGGGKGVGPTFTVVSCGCAQAGKSALLEGTGALGQGLMSLLVSSILGNISPDIKVSMSAAELFGGQARDLLASHLEPPIQEGWKNAVCVPVNGAIDFDRIVCWIAGARKQSNQQSAGWTASSKHPHAHALIVVRFTSSTGGGEASLHFVDACASVGEKSGSSYEGSYPSAKHQPRHLLWSQSEAIAHGEMLILAEALCQLQSGAERVDGRLLDSSLLTCFLKSALAAPEAAASVIVNVSPEADFKDDAAEALLFAETLNCLPPSTTDL